MFARVPCYNSGAVYVSVFVFILPRVFTASALIISLLVQAKNIYTVEISSLKAGKSWVAQFSVIIITIHRLPYLREEEEYGQKMMHDSFPVRVQLWHA